MDLDALDGVLKFITAVGAIIIPGALYIVRNEVRSSHLDLKSKYDLLDQKVSNHIENDEDYQKRAEKLFERIAKHLNIL